MTDCDRVDHLERECRLFDLSIGQEEFSELVVLWSDETTDPSCKGRTLREAIDQSIARFGESEPTKSVSATEKARQEGAAAEREAIIHLLLDEADQLAEIMDGYIESVRTGRHSGRRIRKEMAQAFAREFQQRAESVTLVADAIRGRTDTGGFDVGEGGAGG